MLPECSGYQGISQKRYSRELTKIVLKRPFSVNVLMNDETSLTTIVRLAMLEFTKYKGTQANVRYREKKMFEPNPLAWL